MCLTLRSNSKKPYVKNTDGPNIRYKILDTGDGISFRSPWMGEKTYLENKWNTATLNRIPTQEGFHVFVDKAGTFDFLYMERRVVKIEVKGFLRSGHFGNRRSETYKQFRILEIYP